MILRKANELFSLIKDLQIKVIRDINDELIKEAGKYKINFKMSYADSYVLSTAYINNAIVISTDHHEFDTIEQNTDIKFYWLR